MFRKIVYLALLACFSFGAYGCNQQNTKHEHPLTFIDTIQPDCINAGRKSYFVCETCDKLFLDENGKQETTTKELELSNLGHSDKDDNGKCDRCQKDMEVTPIPPSSNSGGIELPELEF